MGYYLRCYGKYIVIAVVVIVAVVVGVVLYSNAQKERQEKQLAYRMEGIAYMEEEKYEEALAVFQKALADSKGDIDEAEMDICFYKALAQYELGDTEGALETYTSVIDYNGNAKAYFLRGNLYYSLEEEDKALADYAKAVEKEKEDYELYIAIYEVLAANDKLEKGKEYLKSALEIGGNGVDDKIQKGRINVLLGEYEEAITLLTEAAKKDADSYYYLFLAYDAMENKELAIENLDTYLEEEKALDSYKLYDMGKSLLEQENHNTAIECFKKALELEEVPNQQVIMKALVIAYEKELDFTSAKEVMAKYVELYPEDEEALREYTFLETR